jgi:glycosyltransferase involved in cell wall biosynthesis
MNQPLVSILLAVRNEEKYLPAALESIYRQTLPDWELVIVDDGSTDSTAEIIRYHAERDPRIRPLLKAAEGLIPALNQGLQACRAELIARMDGDDICHPRRLEKQYTFMTENLNTTLVACDIRHFPSHVVRGGMRYYEKWQNSLHDHDEIMRNLFVESPLTQPSVMFRKQNVLQVGAYRDMGWAEDYDLWLRMADSGAKFARLPETLFFWREHTDRLTHTGSQCSLDAFRRCRAHHLKRGYLKELSSVTLWGVGLEGKEWRKVLLDVGIAVHHWIDIDPGKLGQTIHGAEVAEPDSLKPGCGPMLITIGVRGARRLVREKCHELGLIEGRDYICVT